MYHQVQNVLSFYGNNTIDGSIILKRRYLPEIKSLGSTEIWTRIAGFRVQSANHYTIEPVTNIRWNLVT